MKLDLHAVTEGKVGRKSGRQPGAMPAWVKIFGIVALIVITIVAGLHLASGGMGHLSHGDMNDHPAPAEHSRHL